MADTQHSKRFAQIKRDYDRGLLNFFMLRLYTHLEYITPEEFTEISGKEYVDPMPIPKK